MFNSANQEERESVDQYLYRLRKLASTCNYGAICDEMLRDRLVIGIADHAVRRRLLREKDLSLNTALDIIRASERASMQLKKIGGEDTPVHAIDRKQKKTYTKKADNESAKTYDCKYCGSNHKKRQCPAFGKESNKCHKKNHFAKLCKSKTSADSTKAKPRRKKRIHQIAESDEENEEVSSSEGPIYAVKDLKQYMFRPQVRRNVNSPWTNIRMQIDNGAAANCLALRDYESITDKPVLGKSTAKLTSYSGDRIKPKGQVSFDVQIGGKLVRYVLFQVIQVAPCSLLLGQTSEALQLMTIKKDLLIHSLTDGKELTTEEVLQEYKDVFTR